MPLFAAAAVDVTASAAADAIAADAFASVGMGVAGSGYAAAATGMTGLEELSLGSSLLSGAGQIMSGIAGSSAAKYNAEIASNNAILERQNATATILEGEANAAAASMATKAKVGGILANQGASGVDVNSGSSVDTRSSAAQNGELNAINIRSQAARAAYGHESEAANAGGEQSMYSSEASMSGIAGGINAGGALLSGATNPSNPFGAYLAGKSVSGDNADYIGTS